MSDVFTGFVVGKKDTDSKVFEKSFTRKNGSKGTSYSFRVADANGDEVDAWFQAGFEPPPVKDGDYVRFSADKNARGGYTPDFSTLKHGKNPPARKGPEKASHSSGGKAAGKGGSKDSYWNSDQKRYDTGYHAARASAIETVSVLLAQNSLPVAAAQGKAGKAKRYEEIIDFIEKLTVMYFRDEFPDAEVEGWRLLTKIADPGLESVKDAGSLPDADDAEEEFEDDFNDDVVTDDEGDDFDSADDGDDFE